MNQPPYYSLVLDYFKTDILSQSNLPDDLRREIESTFEYAFRKRQHIRSVIHELSGTELEKIRKRVIKRLGSTMNPFPVKLGEIKPILAERAATTDRSMHGYILHVLRRHCEYGDYLPMRRRRIKTKVYSDIQLVITRDWLK